MKVMISTVLAVLACTLSVSAQPALFVFSQEDENKKTQYFVFLLTNPEKIAEARKVLSDPQYPKRTVVGTIVKRRALYNPQWSFHLAPSSIGFTNTLIEVCDASIPQINARLSEVGGAYLPNSFWCPWKSKLEGEINLLAE
jgi:hypothetical protein